MSNVSTTVPIIDDSECGAGGGGGGRVRKMNEEAERWRKHKKDIQRMLHFRFMKHKTVHITKVVKDIDWRSDNEVHLVVVAALAGSPIGDLTQLTGARAQLMKFEVLLVRNEGRFLVRSVKWAHAYPTDFI